MLIKIENFNDKLTIHDDDVINENFVELLFNEVSIIVNVDELYIAVKAFKENKKQQRNNDLYYKKKNDEYT